MPRPPPTARHSVAEATATLAMETNTTITVTNGS